MEKIFETNSGFHVKQGTTGEGNFYFQESFASVDKIFILGGRLSTKL